MNSSRKHKLVRASYEARCPIDFNDEIAKRAPGFTLRAIREKRESKCSAQTAWLRALGFHVRGWWDW